MQVILMQLFSYIDPGSGSLILQATIGVLFGIAVFFRNSFGQVFQSIKRVFRGNKKNNEK
jgi:hypothetical protein